MPTSSRSSSLRNDPAHVASPGPLRGAGEVQAVQLERSGLVETSRGRVHAVAGQWLITERDGTVRVLSDEMFRWQMLRQQLSRLVLRGRRTRRAKA